MTNVESLILTSGRRRAGPVEQPVELSARDFVRFRRAPAHRLEPDNPLAACFSLDEMTGCRGGGAARRPGLRGRDTRTTRVPRVPARPVRVHV